MGSLPLHPAVVHVPLGIAVIVPFLAAFALALTWRRGLPRRVWALVVGVQLALVASSLVAMRTGGQEEERVEDVVAERAIETHEEAAEAFVWGAGAALALAVLGLALTGARGRAAAVVATGAMFLVLGLAVRTGHEGGTLVYAHNAGAAYATALRAGAGAAGETREGGAGAVTRAQRGDDDADERHER